MVSFHSIQSPEGTDSQKSTVKSSVEGDLLIGNPYAPHLDSYERRHVPIATID